MVGAVYMTDLIRDLTPTAAELVCAVADRDESQTHELLLGLSHQELLGIAVILADSVPMDRPLGAGEAQTTAAKVTRIAYAVSDYTGVSTADIYSKNRDREIAEARQLICWVSQAVGLHPRHVGKALGRDRSTVLHSTEKVTSTPKLLQAARRIHHEFEQKGAA